MKIVFFILCISFAVLIILFLNLKFKVLFLVTTENQSLYYTLNHRFLNLMQGKVLVLGNREISVIVKKNVLLSKSTSEQFSKAFAIELLSRIKLKRLDVYIDTGFVSDAFVSAMIAGGTTGLAGVVKSYLSWSQTETRVFVSHGFKTKNYSLAVDLNIKISAIKIITSVLSANRKVVKIEKGEKCYAK